MNYYLLAAFIWCSIGGFIGGALMQQMEHDRITGTYYQEEPETSVMRWTVFWPFFIMAILGSVVMQYIHEANKRSDKKKG